MREVQIRILVIFSMVAMAHIVSGQERDLDSLVKKFDTYRNNALNEKIFVHISQQFFLTGETLWFKVYTVDGSLQKPVDVSKIVYVEILDKDNAPVVQTKVMLKNGRGNGSIFLPASLYSGNYKLRAYTQWMRNFGAEFYFEHSITIVNTFKKLETETSKIEEQLLTAEFFPEGGELISGVKSRVGFRVTNKSGKGVEFRGAIINSTRDTVVTFRPLKFGIGNFYFSPQIGERYEAVIKDFGGHVSTHSIPAVRQGGYTMHLSDSNQQYVNIQVISQPTQEPQKPIVYLFVHARQIMIKAEFKFLSQTGALFRINKDELLDGISQFTIFDGDLIPVCERLYFKRPTNKLTIQIQSNEQYATRNKVSLKISTADNQGTHPANLSVSVYKMDSLGNNDSQQDILSCLWLSSDLKGIVESPSYYFSNDSSVKEATDNLMLTHGWRRFVWNDVVKNKFPMAFVPEYGGHILRGNVVNNQGASNAGIATYLSVPNKIIRLYPSRSNERGEVQYEVNDFYGPHRLILQTDTSTDSIFSIEIKTPFSTEFSSKPLPKLNLSPSLGRSILSRSIAMQVQDIFQEETVNQLTYPVDSVAFYGKAEDTYLLDDYTRFPVMEEVMREYIPSVFVRKRRDGFHFLVLDNARHSVFQQDPLILLDGLPVFEVDKIMAFDPRKVKKLDVLPIRYHLGSMSFSGVVSYSTYHGDLGGFELDKKAVSINYEGLQLQREFYSPRYENQKQQTSRVADSRFLLYWNPDVTTQAEGSTLEFYTSDVTGNFQVVIQGLSADGVPGNTVHSFSVK